MYEGNTMTATEATAQSPYNAAVRQHNGQPMIYSTIARRMFLQSSRPGDEPVFEEVTADEMHSYLGYEDWRPWDKPLPSYL
jgi:hypothetical protein